MVPPIIPENEADRLAALHRYDVLDSPPETSFDDLTRLASTLCGTPIAAISLVDWDRQWCKSKIGIDSLEISREDSLCAHAINDSLPLIVPDTLLDPRFADNPLVEAGIRFYAGAPLVTPEGYRLGTLCVIDRAPRELTSEQSEALQALARQTIALMEGRLALRQARASIEARHRAVAASERTEALFAKIFNVSPVGIVVSSHADGIIINASPSYLAMLGYTAEELIGCTSYDLDLVLDPGPRDEMLNRIVADGRSTGVDMTLRRKDRSLVQVLVNSELIELEGRPPCILSMVQDISDRKRAEDELRKSTEQLRDQAEILNLAHETIFVRDLDGRIVYWNRGAEDMYGISSRDALGQVSHQLLRTEFPIPFRDIERQIFDAGRWDGELIHTRIDGNALAVMSRWALQRNAQGEPRAIIEINHDITERKRAAAELLQARDAALESARLKSDFLANMSHEIRTPMNGVIGMTGLLLDTDLNSEQREYVDTIRDSADSLLTIINDILDFSKMESGKLIFEEMDFNLGSTVEGAVDLLAERANAKRIELLYALGSDVPTYLRGDPGRLRQILTNLLANAVKFTENGEVVLRVRRESETAAVSWLHFEVCDTGIGIAPDTTKLLFQTFTQADSSTTRKYGGTGLGLAICKQLVDQMGGQIGVESTVGRGSRFWFTVPLAKADGAPDSPPDHDALRGRRILVVDDNATNRKILHEQLIGQGMACTSVPGGRSALDELQRRAATNRPFDLAILDMQMPDMDGGMLARAIKADESLRAMPIVILTSYSGWLDASEMEAIGIAAALTKPVKRSQLLQCLDSLLSGSRPARSVLTPALAAPPAPLRHGRILVAEDNSVNRKVALRQLQKLGYSSDAVANGLEAVKALEAVPYDVILMDCNMPEMDGFAAAREIRAREAKLSEAVREPDSAGGGSRTVIIAMTANALTGDRDRCLEAGMDDYISKPVKTEELEAVLARWLDDPSSEMNNASDEPIDSSKLEEFRELGGEELVREMSELYLGNSAILIASLRAAMECEDATALLNHAHTLKGSSGTVGATTMAHLCEQLEAGARGNDWPAVARIFDLLVEGFGAVEGVLKLGAAVAPIVAP